MFYKKPWKAPRMGAKGSSRNHVIFESGGRYLPKDLGPLNGPFYSKRDLRGGVSEFWKIG
jgi:hypothetical protein